MRGSYFCNYNPRVNDSAVGRLAHFKPTLQVFGGGLDVHQVSFYSKVTVPPISPYGCFVSPNGCFISTYECFEKLPEVKFNTNLAQRGARLVSCIGVKS